MNLCSQIRAHFRESIERILAEMPQSISRQAAEKILRANRPHADRKHSLCRQWYRQMWLALALRFDAKRPHAGAVQVSHEGIVCGLCGAGKNNRRQGCLGCLAARAEWDRGADLVMRAFAADTPGGIIADRMEEKGFSVCPRLLRSRDI